MAVDRISQKRTRPKSHMKLISIWVPETMLKALDELVEMGYFPSKSELIRYAIAEYLRSTRGIGITKNFRMFFGP